MSKGKGRSTIHFTGRAAADVCGELAWELSRNSKSTGKTLETMVMPAEMPTTNQTSRTDARVQGNLQREYEQTFADLPEHAKWTKLCSNAGLAKTREKRTVSHDA